MNRGRLTWLVIGVIGWTGIVWLGIKLGSSATSSVGFDLELLLEAGGRVAAGLSPYDPALVGGSSPAAPSLFYSYPPPVAQVLSLVAGVPSPVMLVAWDVAAVIGLFGVTEALRRRFAPALDVADVAFPVFGAMPLVFPFAVGLLFGNLDVFFPLLYGSMLLAAVTTSRRTRIAGGVALAAASLKLHPASMGVWFLARAARERRDGAPTVSWTVVAAALITGVLIVVVSVVFFGVGPWQDYWAVIRAGSGADIVDPRNAGPAGLIASVLGAGDALARMLQVPISVGVVVVTTVVAWRTRDPVASLTVAAVASLITLPVTWYHYPSALIPFAIAAILRAQGTTAVTRTVRLVVAAVVVGGLAIAWLPLLWVAVGLVVAAVLTSREPERD